MHEGLIREVTDTNLADLQGSTSPILLDFWASWCIPCSRMAAVVEQFAHDFAGLALNSEWAQWGTPAL